MSQQLAPKRVIMELSPTEQFIRVVQVILQHREAGRARLDADCANRVREAQIKFLGTPDDPNAPDAPDEPVTG